MRALLRSLKVACLGSPRSRAVGHPWEKAVLPDCLSCSTRSISIDQRLYRDPLNVTLDQFAVCARCIVGMNPIGAQFLLERVVSRSMTRQSSPRGRTDRAL